jgi:hypothetical protein
MGSIRCCLVVYLLSLSLAALSHAGFVNGVEGFDGTSKEPSVWEEYHATNQGFAAQNNAMLLASPASGSGIEYTTTLAQVGIGGSVRVEVSEASLKPGGSYASLVLTTNSFGTTWQFSFDDHWLEMDYFDGTGFSSWYGGDGSSTGMIESGTYTSTPGEMVKLEINRLSATTAAFSAFAADNTLLFTRTHTFSGMPSSLYVALFAYNLDATFDNVTLTGNYVVPEPTLLAPLAAVTLLYRRPRRRRHSR